MRCLDMPEAVNHASRIKEPLKRTGERAYSTAGELPRDFLITKKTISPMTASVSAAQKSRKNNKQNSEMAIDDVEG